MSDRLERMRRNPVADWTIRDVELLCREYGVIANRPEEAARIIRWRIREWRRNSPYLINARSSPYIFASSSLLSTRWGSSNEQARISDRRRTASSGRRRRFRGYGPGSPRLHERRRHARGSGVEYSRCHHDLD